MLILVEFNREKSQTLSN